MAANCTCPRDGSPYSQARPYCPTCTYYASREAGHPTAVLPPPSPTTTRLRAMPTAQGIGLPDAVTTPPERPPYWPYKSQLEQRYSVLLDEWQAQGQILRWCYEGLLLRLGNRQTINFDFWLTMPDQTMQLHDTKGWMRRQWLEKSKMAAKEYHWIRMFVVRYEAPRWTWDEIPAT